MSRPRYTRAVLRGGVLDGEVVEVEWLIPLAREIFVPVPVEAKLAGPDEGPEAPAPPPPLRYELQYERLGPHLGGGRAPRRDAHGCLVYRWRP